MRVIPAERLALVEKMYVGGSSDRAIQRTVAARFGCTTRAARRYLARVKARLAAAAVMEPGPARARSEALLLETYRLAKRGGLNGSDTKTMAVAATRLAELHGALGPRRIEVTGKDGGPVRVSVDDLCADLADYAARHAGGDAARDAAPVAEPPDAGGASGDRGGPGPGQG